MNTTKIHTADLVAHRTRLAREIADAEAKQARLRAALDVRRKNLNRLDAQLAMTGGDARGPQRHE